MYIIEFRTFRFSQCIVGCGILAVSDMCEPQHTNLIASRKQKQRAQWQCHKGKSAKESEVKACQLQPVHLPPTADPPPKPPHIYHEIFPKCSLCIWINLTAKVKLLTATHLDPYLDPYAQGYMRWSNWIQWNPTLAQCLWPRLTYSCPHFIYAFRLSSFVSFGGCGSCCRWISRCLLPFHAHLDVWMFLLRTVQLMHGEDVGSSSVDIYLKLPCRPSGQSIRQVEFNWIMEELLKACRGCCCYAFCKIERPWSELFGSKLSRMPK